jgi:hypothetical protein
MMSKSQNSSGNAIAGMPATIESGLSSPRTNAIDRLRWVGLAIRIFQGPDVENKRKAAQILKAAVPALVKIRDEHQSERLRKAAPNISTRLLAKWVDRRPARDSPVRCSDQP